MQGCWPSWRSPIGAQWTSDWRRCGEPQAAQEVGSPAPKGCTEAAAQVAAAPLRGLAAAKPGGSPPKILARVLACCGRFFELLLPEGAERMQRLRDEQQAQSPAMEVDAGEAGLNAMRRALAEVEKKEVPPRAAPTDIGAPKGVAVKSTAEAIVAALDAERRALEPEVAQAAAECEAAAERTSTTK